MNQIGKRGREWAAAWRELKPRFERAGIVRCEIHGAKCVGGIYLTPMHSLKRRNANTPELLREVVIACQPCHYEWECKHEAEMCAKVREVIAARPVPI